MGTTRGVRVTAAAGTYLTPHLFAELFKLSKSQQSWHWEYPYRAFAHCRGFATAALRRARALISVPFSGLPLSRPVRILGLVGNYPANNLFRRRLILRRKLQHDADAFQQQRIPTSVAYEALAPVSRDWPLLRADYPRVTEPSARALHS